MRRDVTRSRIWLHNWAIVPSDPLTSSPLRGCWRNRRNGHNRCNRWCSVTIVSKYVMGTGDRGRQTEPLRLHIFDMGPRRRVRTLISDPFTNSQLTCTKVLVGFDRIPLRHGNPGTEVPG